MTVPPISEVKNKPEIQFSLKKRSFADYVKNKTGFVKELLFLFHIFDIENFVV